MAALRHPSHEHPLEPVDSRNVRQVQCDFCNQEVWDDDAAYACRECEFYLHRRCAEAPLHHLSLVHNRLMRCDACKEHLHRGGSSLSCNDCCFDLDLQCALSIVTLPPEEPPETEHIDEGLHDHESTPFFVKWTINQQCVLCTGYTEGDEYICLHPLGKFLIHKRCVRDLFYEDGKMVQRVGYEHSLATFLVEEVGLVCAGCTKCQSERSGEYIDCARCELFVHRDCV